MHITRDGTWHYRGSPIGRKSIVKLFSTVLKLDSEGQYWLETPVERGRIDVEDVPFTAVELDVTGQGRNQRLIFRTNLDEVVTAGPEHSLRVAFDESSGEPSPYVHLRDGLEALLTRAVYYQLAELTVDNPDTGLLGVWSDGVFFALEADEGLVRT
ncbi:MAG: proteophosphoglycan precursor [Alphaproteobacteria bacterium]|nr:proteophosphoglycan precursor [Alphaproteobacteria bacterium]